jgi:hypothetical protein
MLLHFGQRTLVSLSFPWPPNVHPSNGGTFPIRETSGGLVQHSTESSREQHDAQAAQVKERVTALSLERRLYPDNFREPAA